MSIKRLSLLSSLLFAMTSTAFAFPDDAQWIPVQRPEPSDANPTIFELKALSDAVGDATGSSDIVGGTTDAEAALYWFTDATHFYVRMRLDQVPTGGLGLLPLSWSVIFEVDQDFSSYEFILSVDGSASQIKLMQNTNTNVTNAKF